MDARNYYLNEAAEQNWSTRVLERNINTFYYQRILSSKNKNEALLDSKTLEKANHNDFIKDPYVFEFLNIPEPIKAKEAEIETALIKNLQHFLLELGKGYSFVSRQFRISTETSHFYIDLVFYNYLSKVKFTYSKIMSGRHIELIYCSHNTKLPVFLNQTKLSFKIIDF